MSAIIARRYAKALLEIGVETGALDALVDELGRLAATWDDSAELRKVVEDPMVAPTTRRAILADVAAGLGVGPTTRNALAMLADRRRMRVLPAIARRLREMRDAHKGVVRAEVVSATALDEGYYARLRAQLEKMTGKTVVLDRREDPSLIAGVVTRIGDTVYDGSLRARLVSLKSALVAS